MTTPATTPAALSLSVYVYGCSCGETYREIAHAARCRKCRTYSLGGRCLYVTDTRTDEIVWGRLPTAVELVEYEADAEREAEETRRYIAECEQEGELWEEIKAERAAVEATRLAELAEDNLYQVQDQLDGYRLRG